MAYDEMVARPKDKVPDALREMDYFKAMNVFEMFDTMGTCNLTKEAFGRMLKGMSGGKYISQATIDEQFADADLDSSGGIDKFEFLGWVFGTDANYCGSVRKGLSTIEPARVIEYYKNQAKLKKDDELLQYGVINKDEFHNLMNKFSSIKMDKKAATGLFDYIDADRSGGIDLKEFLDWIKQPERVVHKAAPKNERRAASIGAIGGGDGDSRMSSKASTFSEGFGRGGSKAFAGPAVDPIANGERKQSDLFEAPPGRPVILEFTIGGNCDGIIRAMQKALKKSFANQVEVRTTYDVNCVGCRKVMVLCGRGIVLWDRYSMMTYMDDPFRSMEAAKAWIFELLRACIPNLLGTVNLRKAEKQKKPKDARRSSSMGTLARRTTVA